MSKIKVVVVDDSALVRSVLTQMINSQPDMQCVGAAHDPYQARELIRETDPHVITLDVEMPRMDGLDFLEKLMRLRPTPVVMISTLTERGAEITIRALELGAIDFVAKPKLGIAQGMQLATAEITEKIRIAASAKLTRRSAAAAAALSGAPAKAAAPIVTRVPAGISANEPAVAEKRLSAVAPGMIASRPAAPASKARVSTEKLIAVGASTGGTEAIRELLTQLPADFPAVLITQHMPAGFTRSFADRLNTLCKMAVSEAVDGERALPGHAYIAPGGMHMVVERSGANYVLRLLDTEPVNRHKPSVEVMFDSVARVVGGNATGVMLTGMGGDGAAAMRRMREAGAFNVAQDEASCVVYGMPREAVAAGGVHESLPLQAISQRLINRLREGAGFSGRV